MRSRRPIGALFLAVALAACTAAPAGGPSVADAWVRASIGTADPVAAYLVITNSTGHDDALLGASSPAAASAEVHETSTDEGGMTGMAPVARLDVPAGSTVRLAPGGMHLMLMGLIRPLRVGDSVELDLMFEHAGRLVVQAEVRQG